MSQRIYDPESVRELFDAMASTYGYVNLISSFGFCALWRRQTVDGLPLAKATLVVDLMSGMGELWTSLKRLPETARVVGVDLSPGMASRTPKGWRFTTEVLIQDVLEWDCAPESADVVVSSFGLKTFNREQQRVLSQKVAGMLRSGGAFSFLEISVPRSVLLRLVYLFYLRKVIPVIGRLLLGDPACYRMLGIYTEEFGDASYFADCLREQGLQTEFISHFFGCATSVRGYRP